MSNDTQPLPDDSAAPNETHPLWQWLSRPLHLPRATQFGLVAAGGAFTVVGASLAVNWMISGAPGIRSLPQQSNAPIQMTQEEFAAEQAQNGNAASTSIAPGDVHIIEAPLVLVDGANADGSGWKDFPVQTDEDRERVARRREDDRILREKWVLEDRKRQIEREIEKQQLEERYRADDLRLENERREEDRRRIEGRVMEDRGLLDERSKDGEQLAAAD